jgi:fatty acid desaturase
MGAVAGLPRLNTTIEPRAPARHRKQMMDPQPVEPQTNKTPEQKRLSRRTLNILSALVGLLTFAIGLAWLIYAKLPMFAIPLLICVPVIATVAFRNFWD